MLKLLRILLVTSLTALGAFVILPLPYLVWGDVALPGTVEAASWKGLSLGIFHPSAQIMGVWLAGCWLGGRAAITSMVLYLALGLFGLPVFIDGGGVHYASHGAMAPLLAFPLAAWLIAKLRGPGSGRRTFWAVLAGTLLIMAVGILGSMAQTGLWMDARQWLAFIGPNVQSLFGWVFAMGMFAAAAGVADRWIRIWTPAPPPGEEAPEEEDASERPSAPASRSTDQLALPSGRPRDQRQLPPAIAQDARRLPPSTRPQPPAR